MEAERLLRAAEQIMGRVVNMRGSDGKRVGDWFQQAALALAKAKAEEKKELSER